MRKAGHLLMIVLLAVALAACGSGKKDNEGSGNGANSTGAAGSNTEQSSGNAGQSEGSGDSGDSGQSYRIAISQIVEHPSLDATREGFLAALKDAGIEEGVNLTVDYNNAQGDPTNNLSIAQKIAADPNDLVLAIATPSAQAVAQHVKDVPVLFAAVTDPLGANLVDNLEAPSGNVTGASDTNPEAVRKLMDFIAEYLPDVKTVGIIINEGEQNAVVMAENAEQQLATHGIQTVRAAVANTSEVKQAAESLVGRADAFFITLDNTVVSGVDAIIQVANEHDIPFFSSDRDTVERGAFATVGFKYYDHGYQAGQMAVEILKNGKKPSELPVSFPDKLDFILNLKAAAEQNITVTDEMKAVVQDPANNIIE
ncbi:MAG: sugar ABC transporter substrate-binding protein [Thermobacillus sp. ZCTH02-B1]|uniref:ABC transporter substrate-binding protein n=1 Tax=Thermobacillus sp. ZCTH02-B1 TaxID=1858795 RepID=UPI000B55CD49|nr:ABC transporter substrate binding protein [Thermobacillus sp. ZCTH02-B1]OUM94195.1 MAG: sugar ABC transporter substrate-binding protein [Thermobacillus sp. ZCTH02-B1]